MGAGNVADPSPRGQYRGPAMVGRAREQALLRQSLEEMLDGHGSLVLISGEAGIGKSSLVENVAGEAAEQDCLILTGHCYDLTTTPPYGPWLELVRRYEPDGDLPAVPAFVHDAEALAALRSQAVVFEQTLAFFEAVAAQRPLVLVLEDMHWSDQASLDLLRFAAREASNHRLLMLVTYRSDELTRRHALTQLLPALVREANPTRLTVPPLNDEAVESLVKMRYPMSVSNRGRLLASLHDHAEGNPLFVSELLRSLEEQRLLQETPDGWVVDDLRHVQVPVLLRQIIDGRLARLDGSVIDLLSVGAVIGQEVPIDLWRAVTGNEEEELARALEQATEAHLIDEVPGGASWRFGHALVREAVYERTVSLRRRRWHRSVAEVFAHAPQADPDIVAYHFQQAGDDRAKDWLIAAGERAARAHAVGTAIERLEAVVPMIEGSPDEDRRRGWVLFMLGAQYKLTNPMQGMAHLDEAERLGVAAGDQLLVAQSRASRGVSKCYDLRILDGIADMTAGIEMLDRLDRNESPSPEPPVNFLPPSALFRVGRGLWHSVTGAINVALDDVARLITEPPSNHLADTIPTGMLSNLSQIQATAHLAFGRVCALQGRIDEANYALEQAHRWYSRVGDSVQAVSTTLSVIAYLHLPYQTDQMAARQRLLDRIQRERQTAASRLHLTRSLPAEEDLIGLYLNGGWSELERIARAWRQRIHYSIWYPYGESMLARFNWHRGHLAVAWEAVWRMLPEGPDTRPGDAVFLAAQDLQRLAVEMELEAGRVPEAGAWLDAYDRWLSWSGATLGQAESQLLWARYHQVRAVPELARQHGEQALSLASDPRQPLALISIHRFLGRVQSDAKQYTRSEHHMQESLRLADACDIPFERALTLLAQSEIRLAQGRTEDAWSLLTEVRTICEQLDARPTLERVDALVSRLGSANPARPAYPAGLTAREIEVLQLVAQGMTDQQVADRLYLSSRTVSSHLRSVYNKLGVGSRAAASRFAAENDLV